MMKEVLGLLAFRVPLQAGQSGRGLPLIFGLYRLPIIPHGWEDALWYATATGPKMMRQAQWAAAVLAIIIMGVSGRTNGNHTN